MHDSLTGWIEYPETRHHTDWVYLSRADDKYPQAISWDTTVIGRLSTILFSRTTLICSWVVTCIEENVYEYLYMCVCLCNGVRGFLTDDISWPFDCFLSECKWLVDMICDWWTTKPPVAWLNECQNDWIPTRLMDWLVMQLLISMTVQVNHWLTDCLTNWITYWLAGWLANFISDCLTILQVGK